MNKLTPYFQGQKADILIICDQISKIQIDRNSQKVNLLFLRIKKNCSTKFNSVMWSLLALLYITMI